MNGIKKSLKLRTAEILLAFFILLSGNWLAFHSGSFIVNFNTVGFSLVSSVQEGVANVFGFGKRIIMAVHDVVLLEKEYNINIRKVHNDTGLMMYYPDKQDVHAGGSGCGCCGSILCSKILKELSEGKLHRVFVVATGALLSAVSPFQGESIPGIAHGILLTDGR